MRQVKNNKNKQYKLKDEEQTLKLSEGSLMQNQPKYFKIVFTFDFVVQKSTTTLLLLF